MVGLADLNELRPFFDGVKVGIKDGRQVEGTEVGFLLGITVGFLEGEDDVLSDGALEGFLDGTSDFDCAITFTAAFVCEGIDVGMVADIFPIRNKIIKLTKIREKFILYLCILI